MSTALQHHGCRDHLPLLGPYLDGELDPPGMLEVESHLGRCAPCHEHVELLRATRASLKRTVRRNAPDGLRSRIGIAIAAEAARGEARVVDQDRRAIPARTAAWRTMVPIASAAALALLWGAASNGTPSARKEHTAGFDVLAELVAEHSQPLPPEATDPKAVRGLSKYIGVPVRPGSFEKGGARLVGGRVVGVNDQRAAILQYIVMSGDEPRRVSVIVYDPAKIQVNAPDLSPRAVGTAHVPVQVGHSKGYSVAVTEREGVGYALASDLDPDKSAQFAATVYDE